MADTESGSESSMTEDKEREFLLALEAMEKGLLLSISRIADTIDGMRSDIAGMVDGMRSDIADMRMNIARMNDSFDRMDRADRIATIAAWRMNSVQLVERLDWLGRPTLQLERRGRYRVPSPFAK
jgi:hypothetical protein